MVLSVGGGLAGIILGLAIPWAVARYADMATIVTPAAPVLAFGISVTIGLLFGIYPAWRAATPDPVEALAPRIMASLLQAFRLEMVAPKEKVAAAPSAGQTLW